MSTLDALGVLGDILLFFVASFIVRDLVCSLLRKFRKKKSPGKLIIDGVELKEWIILGLTREGDYIKRGLVNGNEPNDIAARELEILAIFDQLRKDDSDTTEGNPGPPLEGKVDKPFPWKPEDRKF